MMNTVFRGMVFVVFLLLGFSGTVQAEGKAEGGDVLSFLSDRISLSGTVEVEAGFSEDYDGVDTSDVTLATVELGMDATVADWATAHILLLWEEDDTEPMEIDEGFITLGGTGTYPVYLSCGRLYVPFGFYESNMISDPLTLEIGETRESALVLGADYAGFYASVYAFNGDVQEGITDDDTMEAYGFGGGYGVETDTFTLDLGVGWISSILDSNGLGDRFSESRGEFMAANPGGTFALKEYVPGYCVHGTISIGPFAVTGEYVAAADDPEYTTDTGIGIIRETGESSPEAFHLECACTFSVMEKEAVASLTWQGTKNLAGFLPETRYGGAFSLALMEHVGIGVEYLHDDDYDPEKGGTGNSAQTVTLQLVLAF